LCPWERTRRERVRPRPEEQPVIRKVRGRWGLWVFGVDIVSDGSR
jgi:hypothetical protein